MKRFGASYTCLHSKRADTCICIKCDNSKTHKLSVTI